MAEAETEGNGVMNSKRLPRASIRIKAKDNMPSAEERIERLEDEVEELREQLAALLAAIEMATRGGVSDVRMGEVPTGELSQKRPELFAKPGEPRFSL